MCQVINIINVNQMQSAADFIVQLLNLNEEIPFQSIFFLIVFYILMLWLVISVWVFFDARKRYDADITAFLFGILVLFLNVPMLVFYFAVRPEIRFEDFDDWETGGVNVPIVNFMGTEGIEMSLELRINPKRVQESKKKHDMSVQIGWDKEDEKFKLINKDDLVEQVMDDIEQKNVFKNRQQKNSSFKIQNTFSNIKGFVKKRVGQVSKNATSFRSNVVKKINVAKKGGRIKDSKENDEVNQPLKQHDNYIDQETSSQKSIQTSEKISIKKKKKKKKKRKKKKK